MKEDNYDQLYEMLNECYNIANTVNNENEIITQLSTEEITVIKRCATTKHAARGAALTLGLSKLVYPEQDIRYFKAEFPNGFSARTIDTSVTVPFLSGNGLPYNVETHWLSQTMSFGDPYLPGKVLKTVPKTAGPDLITIANYIQSADSDLKVREIVTLLLFYLVQERNKGEILLTKPKNLSIDQVLDLLHMHFDYGYKKNAPRLPQVAIYAIYDCLKASVARYEDFDLCPLERLKTANRKSGSVGDIDLIKEGRPIEAVEIKFEIPIDKSIVQEAMQKIKSKSVERYFILSTKPVVQEEIDVINDLKVKFLQSNGCEIIVNGVYETIKYYLRLLKTTNDFINKYTDLLATDPDLNYEHKIAWNSICENR